MSDTPFPPLEPLRIPAGWTVKHNSFTEQEPSFGDEHDLWDFFHEDMLRLENPHTGVLLDLGWYGGEEGGFWLVARRITEEWESPHLRELRTRSKQAIVQSVNEWLEDYA